MGADESLARGLTDRFFTEVDQLWDGVLDSLYKSRHDESMSLKAWQRTMRDREERLAPVLLRSYTANLKKNLFWIGAVLIADELAWLKNWEERAIKVRCLRSDCRNIGGEPFDEHIFELCAHAVQRVIQRSDVAYTLPGGFQREQLFDSLRQVPDWVGFYMYALPRSEEGQVIYPVIPTGTGMFLCERKHNHGWSAISIRTFIACDQMDPLQARVHAAMLSAYEWIGEVPFFVFLEGEHAMRLALSKMANLLLLKMPDCWAEFTRLIARSAGGTVDVELERQLMHHYQATWIADPAIRSALLDTERCPVRFEQLYAEMRKKKPAQRE